MVHLPVETHVWLATLLIVAPIPDWWVKVVTALIMVILILVNGA